MATGCALDVLNMLKGLEAADIAEKVVYRPRSGSPRVVRALVHRQPPEGMPEGAGGLAPILTVDVCNDPVDGIDAAEADTGGDRIELAWRKGGDMEDRSIARVISHDAGNVRLEVR